MKKKRKFFYFIPFIIIGVLAALSGAVMLLWNNIVTEIFSVKRLSYLQAAGLLVLCKILFTSFKPGPPGGFRRGGPPWKNKLMDLSPDERDRFKEEWEKRKRENQF